MVAVPRLVLGLGRQPWGDARAWADTRFSLPSGTWTNVLDPGGPGGPGEVTTFPAGPVRVARLFAGFPAAVLVRSEDAG